MTNIIDAIVGLIAGSVILKVLDNLNLHFVYPEVNSHVNKM